MADTCSGWAPVSLMSHQFVASSDGSMATALGWGLDKSVNYLLPILERLIR